MDVFTYRWDFLRPLVEGKSVLDVGPAELVGTVNKKKRERWIHGQMAEVATRLVGIEASEEQVQALRTEGFDIRLGDAETFDLGEEFDVIVAGELIEHLSNPGVFLERARRHLRPGGVLALTTPNRYGALSILAVLRTGEHPRYLKPLAKHVVYFDSDSLSSLLERHGFGNVDVSYCRWVGAESSSWARRRFVDVVSRLRPTMLSTMLVTARPVQAEPAVADTTTTPNAS
jgi:SAM-dependent methyltransferase